MLLGIRIVRTRELLLRWTELCAFSGAVLRTHEGLTPADNHQIWSDDGTLSHFLTFSRIFVAFRPYASYSLPATLAIISRLACPHVCPS